MFDKIMGSARIIKGYSVAKKLLDRGYTLEEISEDFNVNLKELEGFVSICDRLAKGEQVFSLDPLNTPVVDALANAK
jgi:hypothetical protein